MDVSGKVAVVTGASSGIGRATAELLAARGAQLLLVGRDRERLERVASATGGRPIVHDLADPGRLGELADALLAGEPPALVVHNAGVGMHGPAHAYDPRAVRDLFQVDVLAPMELTGALLPRMRERAAAGHPGHLAFVTSVAGRLGVPDESAYAAAKAALGGYADSLRDELAACGIGVTVVAPGIVDTEFFARRGVPHGRSRPRPVTAERVAADLLRAVEAGRPELFTPRWLRGPVVLRHLAPTTYARLSAAAARRH